MYPHSCSFTDVLADFLERVQNLRGPDFYHACLGLVQSWQGGRITLPKSPSGREGAECVLTLIDLLCQDENDLIWYSGDALIPRTPPKRLSKTFHEHSCGIEEIWNDNHLIECVDLYRTALIRMSQRLPEAYDEDLPPDFVDLLDEVSAAWNVTPPDLGTIMNVYGRITEYLKTRETHLFDHYRGRSIMPSPSLDGMDKELKSEEAFVPPSDLNPKKRKGDVAKWIASLALYVRRQKDLSYDEALRYVLYNENVEGTVLFKHCMEARQMFRKRNDPKYYKTTLKFESILSLARKLGARCSPEKRDAAMTNRFEILKLIEESKSHEERPGEFLEPRKSPRRRKSNSKESGRDGGNFRPPRGV